MTSAYLSVWKVSDSWWTISVVHTLLDTIINVFVFFALKKERKKDYFKVVAVTQLRPMSEQNKSKCDFGFKPASDVRRFSDFISLKSAVFKFLCKLFLVVYSYLNSWIVALCPTLYQRRVSNTEPLCHRDRTLIYGWLRQNLFWDDTQSGRAIPSAHVTGGGKQPLPSAYTGHE